VIPLGGEDECGWPGTGQGWQGGRDWLEMRLKLKVVGFIGAAKSDLGSWFSQAGGLVTPLVICLMLPAESLAASWGVRPRGAGAWRLGAVGVPTRFRTPVHGEPGARPVALSRVMLPSHSRGQHKCLHRQQSPAHCSMQLGATPAISGIGKHTRIPKILA
jgi:hypothetical protein